MFNNIEFLRMVIILAGTARPTMGEDISTVLVDFLMTPVKDNISSSQTVIKYYLKQKKEPAPNFHGQQNV